jgi:hypothetical protein
VKKILNSLLIGFSGLRKRKRPPIVDAQNYSLTRFDDQDIILENDKQIQEFLPAILGQALARTWVDKRFLEVFCDRPKEMLELSGVFLPESISVEFFKENMKRPKVVVFQTDGSKRKRLLELKLVMVAET